MRKRRFVLMLVFCLVIGQFTDRLGGMTIQSSSQVTERKFALMLASSLKLADDKASASALLNAAYKKKLVTDSDKKSMSAVLTKSRAAVYLNRADVLLHGSTYDKTKYNNVVKYKRISDLNTIKKNARSSVVKVFIKGIMAGYSNGYYVQSRKFSGSDLVTSAQAKTYIARVTHPGKREKLSPDGQLIRTDNLPKNASSYPYILTTYPNWFYERTFEYQKTKFHKTPVALKDYASPLQIGKMKFYNGTTMKTIMDQYLMNWCKKVETNMKLRFNVDYRTIDNNWVNQLRKTYYVFDDAGSNRIQTEEIKEYVRNVRKNRVVVKAERVVVEPSTVYNCIKDYIRVYVKFKVISGEIGSKNLLYCEKHDITNLKKGIWIEKCFDVSIGSMNAYSNGSDYAIIDNKLLQA